MHNEATLFLGIASEGWTAIATIALAAATIALVIFTGWLALEARKTRREQTRPDVIVSLDNHRIFAFYDLVIENVGPGTAWNITAELLTDNRQTDGNRSLSYLSVYNLKNLKPGTSVKTYIGRHGELEPKLFRWLVRFEAADGEKFEQECATDLSSYDDQGALGAEPAAEIAKSLKELQGDLRRLVSGSSRLQVDAFNSVDREREAAERTRRRAAASALPGGLGTATVQNNNEP